MKLLNSSLVSIRHSIIWLAIDVLAKQEMLKECLNKLCAPADWLFPSVYPWGSHSQDIRFLLEPEWTLGHLLCIWGQHYASLADGEYNYLSSVTFSHTVSILVNQQRLNPVNKLQYYISLLLIHEESPQCECTFRLNVLQIKLLLLLAGREYLQWWGNRQHPCIRAGGLKFQSTGATQTQPGTSLFRSSPVQSSSWTSSTRWTSRDGTILSSAWSSLLPALVDHTLLFHILTYE